MSFIKNTETLEEFQLNIVSVDFFRGDAFILSAVHQRMMEYDVAITELEQTKGLKISVKGVKGVYTKLFLQYFNIVNDMLNVKIKLAKLYFEVGRYQEAYEIYEKLLNQARTVEKGTDPSSNTAFILLYTSTTLNSLNRHEEALKNGKEALEIIERIYDKDSPIVGDCLSVIAQTLDSLGDYEAALWHYKKSLEIHKSDYGNTASILLNIAATLERLGNYEEALKCRKESLNIYQKIYKIDNPHLAYALNDVGASLQSLGKYKEALE